MFTVLHLSVFFAWLVSCVASSTVSQTDETFRWSNVKPAEELVYEPCFDGFQCARLCVPMDWNGADPDNNKTVEIAIIKVPATVPVTDPTYAGAIVLNPGGPGGSGVAQVLNGGYSYRTILSAGPNATNDTARNFDIIGFDPRGVNNTTPIFTCFADEVERQIFDITTEASGVFASSDVAFDIHWARTRAYAESCSQRAIDAGIGEHMSTPYVVRDIVEIFERHGQWREKEARTLLSSTLRQSNQAVLASNSNDVLNRARWRSGQEMVQYWGFSYGSILGATLSAMYPERIERAVLDGVADSHDYMSKIGWTTNLQDTDMNMVSFADYCYQFGKDNCAMWHPDGPAFIIENVAKIISDIKSNPLGVPATATRGAQVATYSDLKRMLWNKLYSPLQSYTVIARALAGLAQGNGTALIAWKLAQRANVTEGLSDACRRDGSYSRACFEHKYPGMEAAAGILCTDAPPQRDISRNEYWGYAQQLMRDSRLIGDTWGTIRVPCTAWKAQAKWRYEGDFHNDTAHPILLIGNTVDPVTPLRNAFTMAAGFPGSVVLHQNSEGHCSTASPSFCTARALRTYFQTGDLPEEGTICEPARLPFDGFSEEKEPKIPEGETDEELWGAMVQLTK